MRVIELTKKLVDILDEHERAIGSGPDLEIVVKLVDGTIMRVNNVVWQADACEIQLFVAPA